MEKLEAALAKARQQRKMVLNEPGVPPEAEADAPPVPEIWASVPLVTPGKELMERNRIFTQGGRDAGPFDMLRAKVLRAMKEKNWTRLAITAPEAGAGKSTVALNLALSLARQKELRVMLLDFDFRRPSLHRILGQKVTASLHEAIEGKHALGDVAVRLDDNCLVALNATAHHHPAELLHSALAARFLDTVEQQWKPDVMLFDLSPMLVSDDNVGFLPNVDCAVMIAAAEATTVSNIDLCEKDLAQLTNVLGIVLNKCRYPDETMSYAYGTY